MLQMLIGTNLPFMKYRRWAYLFSGLLVVSTIIWLVLHGGPYYSVDFTGGTVLQIRTSQVLHADQVRKALDRAGFSGFELQQMTGQQSQGEYLLRFKGETKDAFDGVQQALLAAFPGLGVDLRSHVMVGPKVGNELRQKALWAVIWSLGGILLYVGFRYEFKFAFGAVVSLFHDVFVVFGLLCFTGREISLTVIAALLTIAGYSINDTIVVFDRIRERAKDLRKEKHSRAFDIAVNETLSRTVITALTVFLAALGLFIWGGEVLHDFSFAMLVGTVFGTYSSVYVASALALETWIWLDRRKGIQAE